MDDAQAPATFAEAVKTFTPGGTNFDEFKAALHSQGAPGAISPEFVAALNASGIGAYQTQQGTTCARCGSLHGGPPGRACLEAEAHLGRSPLRRSPDLQLDAISARSAPSALPPGPASAAVIGAHEQFTDFLQAGFTEDQALKLLAYMITSGGRGGDDG